MPAPPDPPPTTSPAAAAGQSDGRAIPWWSSLDTPPATDTSAAKKEQREAIQSWIDASVKILQLVVVVGGGMIGLLQYLEQYNKDVEVRQGQLKEDIKKQVEAVDARKRAGYMKFHEEQRPVYVALCRAASKIVSTKQFTDVSADITTFREIHSGELFLVCDQSVIRAANAFNDVLESELKEGKVPSANLRNHSIFLAMACQQSLNLNRAFGVELDLVPFPPLDDSPYSF